MKKNLIKHLSALLIFYFVAAPSLWPQRNARPYIGYTDLELVSDSIIKILYSIENSDSSRLHEVRLIFFSKDDSKALFPASIEGDVGYVRGSGNKEIIWNIAKDFNHLEEDFYPIIILDGSSLLALSSGGWKNALLSFAVPGLGDYFVSEQRNMKFKPWMRTVSSLGFIGLGYYCDKNRTRDEYVELKYVMGSPYEGAPFVPMFVPYIIPGEVHYRLFKWDSEIFYTIGASIWFTDILWVFNKGYMNDKISRFYYGKDLKIYASNRGLGFQLTF